MSRARRILLALPGAMLRALPRLRLLGAQELLLLLQAPFVLPVVALLLRRRGLSAVQELLLGSASKNAARTPDPVEHARVERIAWVVQVAAAYGPWPANCLQRSVVLCWFLHRQGLHGELRIGVRRTEDDSLDFHAWVEHDGRVVNDRRDVRQRYATFAGAIVPRQARFS